MPDQIYIGNFAKGLIRNRLPFNIDNDAFPTMYNFYSWRGRGKRKRGTFLIGQLQIQLELAAVPNNWQKAQLVLVADAGNLISNYSLDATASIVPGSISLTVGANTYTDPDQDGTLVGAPAGSGTINYATGAITIVGGGNVTGTFSYYPGLPVMGLEDYIVPTSQYPLLIAFDTTYAYQINQAGSMATFYDVSYYKITNSPVTWSGQDYQQFWSTNYEGAFWATNNKPGFHFVNATYVSGSGTPNIVFNFKSLGVNYTSLVNGDRVWFNEWSGSTINGLTGEVTDDSAAAVGNYQVTFTGNQTVAGTGIAQLLTASISGQDGIRWYDGDPTGGTGIPVGTGTGWVNFSPPLTATSVSFNGRTSGLYYLTGALAIVPFKDRLIFFSPTIQTSSGLSFTLIDTALWSWNGTPYYATPTPTGQTSDVTAYYVDQTGKGGYQSAGLAQNIVTVNNNEDVLLVGFTGRQTRFVYTGNDLYPFLFYNINSELGSSATFSGITLDQGGLTIGTYGIAMTNQQSAQRIDLEIPDEVFEIQAQNNGAQRVSGVRDYYREWIYFSYPITTKKYADNSICVFPLQTFLYNYRDQTWSILYENFTTYGTFRRTQKYNWSTIPFDTWDTWREPWNSGSSSPQFPSVIGGNPQGYVLGKGQGTGESVSGTIQAIASSAGNTQITSIDHCVAIGDYLYLSGIIGSGDITDLNTQIGRVIRADDADTFVVDVLFPGGTYLGLGKFTRLSQPLIQTKQFPFYWQEGRQVRLGVQKYLMDRTANGQVTVNIYLSQDPDNAWNSNPLDPPPNAIIYSQLMYTCPESTNIGLTPANVNLQMPTAATQFQIWHRFSTSLIGDSFQIGITLDDTQMRNLAYATSEIALHGMHLTVEKGPHLA